MKKTKPILDKKTEKELKKFVEEQFKWNEVYDGWSDGEEKYWRLSKLRIKSKKWWEFWK